MKVNQFKKSITKNITKIDSYNVIKRELKGLLSNANSNLTKDGLKNTFETLYNTPYKGKTVSTK